MLVQNYLTIESQTHGEYKEKGSKFLAYVYPVQTEDEIKTFIEILKKEHHAARHHCWAYKLLPDASKYRAYDDGEPSNSAGKPILGQIEAFGLTHVLIVVVRYFGGTLLGVGGLMHAYKEAAKDAINNAIIITKQVEKRYAITCTYESTNVVLAACKLCNGKLISQNFAEQCRITCDIPLQFDLAFLQKIEHHTIQILKII